MSLFASTDRLTVRVDEVVPPGVNNAVSLLGPASAVAGPGQSGRASKWLIPCKLPVVELPAGDECWQASDKWWGRVFCITTKGYDVELRGRL